MKRIIILAVLAVAGCATAPSQATDVAALQSGYLAAATAESLYISSGSASVPVIKQIEAYRLPAYNAIEPLVQAEESGASVVTAAETEAAQAALTALTAYLATQNISTGAT